MGDTVEAYPLTWPAGVPRTPAGRRTRAKFGRGTTYEHKRYDGSTWTSRGKDKLTVAQARDRLAAELDRLGARGVVLSTQLELRLDGLPRSGQRMPDDPGAACYFTLDGVQHCLPCDRWDRVEDNIAAIAKHVEATRGQLRWGVGDVKAAFAGFKALPPAGGSSPSTGALWHDVLQVPPTAALEVIKSRYRELAAKHHPDRGGDAGAMAMINRAWEQAQAARAVS